MFLDDLQQTWQSQHEERLRVDPELLLNEVQRNQRNFKQTIFWRDFREVIVAVVMAVWFAWDGLSRDGWPWMLLSGTCLWVGGFILIDRYRRRGRAARFEDSLLGCTEAALEDVEHQIWLLKNVFWWYILPPAVGIAVALVHMALGVDGEPKWLAWALFLAVGAFCAAVGAGVYWINQFAVRTELEPRRQELLAVRESLTRTE
jgi:drug/metabolite transporter (DMT)-like permease